jgi:uncharacterized protein (DUF488 family)
MFAVDQLTGLTGIGYEGHDVCSFLDRLHRDEVSVVVDVRLTPISRKRGFSKRALGEALAEAGIDYRHAPALGNPKQNRAGFAGDAAELTTARQTFAGVLSTSAADEWLTGIAELAAAQRVALLCFEADQRRCHRDVVAAAVADRMAGLHRLG